MYLSNIGGVFIIEQQQKLVLNLYMEIYELIIPKDNLLRQIKELVDFSFIYDALLANYCLDNGGNAVPPIRIFKYLLLKSIYDLSDIDLVERSKYDMSFKYFLELTPEEEVIHPSLLTKFRKQRLKDENILDLLINKSVELAINQGVLKSNTIIVDSTHTEARYHKTTQREMLKKASTSLKAALKDSDKDIYLPDEPEKRASLDEYNEYCHELLNTVQESPYSELPTIKEESSMLSEILARLSSVKLSDLER